MVIGDSSFFDASGHNLATEQYRIAFFAVTD